MSRLQRGSASSAVKTTHKATPVYKPARQLYPWVYLHPDGKLRSVYSGQGFEPEALIREDFAIEGERSVRLRELVVSEAAGAERVAEEIDALEDALPFNCEHVVPQSWFSKREPMRGDLHHLFACESRCNSLRGNTPYFEFADFEEVVQDACGKREGEGFEPSAGKGAVARAVLYFLLRYPKAIEDPQEFGSERLATLLDWHDAEAVGGVRAPPQSGDLRGPREPQSPDRPPRVGLADRL